MACIVKSQRLQDIFNLVNALVVDPELDINDIDGVLAYFQENFPEVTELEIYQAVTPVDDVKREELTETLQATKDRLKKLSSATKRLNDILELNVKQPRKKSATPKEAKEINQIIKDIRNLAGLDVKIPPEAYIDILARLEDLGILQDAWFQMSGTPVGEEHIKRAIEHLNQIKRSAKIDNIDGKIQELDQQIADLNSGDLTFEDIENLNTNVKFKGLDDEIARKELELGEKRVELDLALRRAKRKHRASKGILGIKNTTTVKAREFSMLFKEHFWEPFRALKFMGDISAWGVQAAPLVYSMMTDFNFKAAMRGDLGAAFASQRALGQIFMETTARLILDGARHSSKWGKSSNSTYAQRLLNDIKSRPAFVLARKAGLQISESRSLTRSEEVFTSNLINKMPIFGAVKDVSEDTMVSTLNALRMLKFELFYEATNGQAPLEEYQKVAEIVNKMTGTTIDPTKTALASGLKYILSAPKLFLSRISLITQQPFKALGGVDIPASLEQRKFMFQTEADGFMFHEMLKAMRGYALTSLLFSLLASSFDFLDWEDDPRESDFLRFRIGGTAIDASGGVGTLYRTLSLATQLTFGPPEGASYTQKDKINYLKEQKGKDGIDALLQGFVKYKLHPTISSGYQAMTGRDFFGDSFSLLGREGVAPHLEGTSRAILPISFEQLIEDYQDISSGEAGFAETLASSALQFVGMNTFRYDNEMSNLQVQEYINDVEYRPRPRYPKFLGTKEESRTKEYFRDKYRDMWGDALGAEILSRGANAETLNEHQLRALNNYVIKRTEIEFLQLYKDEIKALPRKSN